MAIKSCIYLNISILKYILKESTINAMQNIVILDRFQLKFCKI